ncbi:MAG: LysR substrate-binding domain-containing protein [Pseudomonadota bacterium]|nr:LysR substrate-binding domain-containing protein [Pseudomonadota bacterium]
MRRLRDRLPPANSLVVFEAVARRMSFTEASKELLVSQAAVSRQIKLLEDRFEISLFTRRHRAIELTPQGVNFHKAVTIGLNHIAHAADSLQQEKEISDVTVSSTVTFASYWLLSRVAKFRTEFPDIDIRLVASTKGGDLSGTSIDLAVRYGHGAWPNVSAELMFANEIFPVCSPIYLEKKGPIKILPDLLEADLLHLTVFDRNWITWESWLEDFGLRSPAENKKISFDNYMVLIHAAVRGEGIALCGARLAEDLISRGELVRPITATLPSKFSFYLLHDSGKALSPNATKFREWLLSEAHTCQIPPVN